MSQNVWRCRCGKRVEVLTDENFGDCGCSDPVYGPEYFYMSEECADMLDEMDKDYDKQHKQLAEARAEIERLNKREIDLYTAEVWAIARHAFMSGAFKGYEHGTEKRLRDQYFKEWCLKSYPEAVKAALKQSELIERLRARNEVLDAAIADMTEEQAALCAEDQTITELVAAKDRLIEQMVGTLNHCKSTFEDYVKIHKAKMPVVTIGPIPPKWGDMQRKIARNQEAFDLCNAALSAAERMSK